jgi:hypothetical protein
MNLLFSFLFCISLCIYLSRSVSHFVSILLNLYPICIYFAYSLRISLFISHYISLFLYSSFISGSFLRSFRILCSKRMFLRFFFNSINTFIFRTSRFLETLCSSVISRSFILYNLSLFLPNIFGF